MLIRRRDFMKGCCAAIAAMGGGLSHMAFAAPGSRAAETDVLVTIFLRGGMDSVNFIVPHGDADYYANRPNVAVPQPSQTQGALDLDGFFGLHPAAPELLELYQSGQMALVVAAGSPDPTRSHFDAMATMERGTPGSKTLLTGWITRHLQTLSPTASVIPALAAGVGAPLSLLGYTDTAVIADIDSFAYSGSWSVIDSQRLALRRLYTGGHWIQQAGTGAMDAADVIAGQLSGGTYVPDNGAVYPSGGFGDGLALVAQLVKADLGLCTATVDLGGWDTHDGQGDGGGGYFAGQVAELSQGLMALYTDLLAYHSRLTVVVMTEFGRRIRENASGGTDHGHGAMMLVLGGSVQGGLHGTWPGLATDQLDARKDLAVTTDYRQVLSEILVERLGNTDLATVFPGAPPYAPIGVIRGSGTYVPALSGSATAAAGIALGLALRSWERRGGPGSRAADRASGEAEE